MEQLSYGPVISRKQAKEQGLKHYFTGKPCKFGHVSTRFTVSRSCVECGVAHGRRYLFSLKGQESLCRSRAKAKERYASGDQEYIASRRAACKKSNAKNREQRTSYQREKRQTDPRYLVRNRINSRLHALVNAIGSTKAAEFNEIVGCSGAFLANWLAQSFTAGMSWENHGEWHIDHIRPCASFDLTDPEQQKQCFHYTNLQPLWAKDNLAKSDNWEPSAA